jgi:hypothetical protein
VSEPELKEVFSRCVSIYFITSSSIQTTLHIPKSIIVQYVRIRKLVFCLG